MKQICLIIIIALLSIGRVYASTRPDIGISINEYDYYRYNKVIKESSLQYNGLFKVKRLFFSSNGEWEMRISHAHSFYKDNHISYRIVLKLLNGKQDNASVGVTLTFPEWKRDGYLLLPAAAYNGNRFDWRRIRYSPKLNDNRDMGVDAPIIISDVPRLDKNDGPSVIQERSGALSFPFIGMYRENEAIGITFPYRNEYGDLGVNFEELRSGGCVITLQSPIVREKYKYEIADNMAASTDRAANFVAGDSVVFEFTIHNRKATDVNDLFDMFFDLRMSQSNDSITPYYPFSECYNVIERKFNTQNFVPEYGYYSVGMRENFLQDWQIGWTGGMITTYPLLFSNNNTTIENVVANFDWLFPNGISPSGFFWDSGEKGDKWYGGDVRREQTANWHLIRKSGDALYYIMKQFALMNHRGIAEHDAWSNNTAIVANSLVKLFEKYGQYGNFVDSRDGKIVIGGSTSGAIVPAALVLAAQYYNNPHYLHIASLSAEQMYRDYISKGISCGGPGDAMQNPDSESWYAIIESFMLLYETTGEKKWLQYAEVAARQFSTWVMAYNYTFPDSSLFGKLDMKTIGAVYANTQNKHGSPGICTHSGIALLRLYRATNDERYAQLLSQISRCIPAYMSHQDRNVGGMDAGWINERISTTDWFEGIGEINPGSTWAETAMLLSAVELPSIYIDTELQRFFVFDQLTAEYVDKKHLKISNPTRYTARIKIVAEDKKMKQRAWNDLAPYESKAITIPPQESIVINITKHLH